MALVITVAAYVVVVFVFWLLAMPWIGYYAERMIHSRILVRYMDWCLKKQSEMDKKR